MKKIFLPALIFFLAANFFAAETKYISPNNDGVQDSLVVNFRVKDKGKIFGWALVIEDANGNVVRTIGNKVALPTVFNMKNFFKQLKKKKSSIEVPPTVIWNGAMDNGETAPDGEYFYYITASDDSGNSTKTAKASVIVDNTAPQVHISNPPEEQYVFGEGEKINFGIEQSGSEEDRWNATISDASGKVVRNYVWENSAPASFKWNGTDDNGIIVPDGVYKYSISATDRAGNTNENAEISNIIFSAEKPATNIMISGSQYFSIPQKSKINAVTLDVTIPEPRAGSGNALVNWSVEILDKSGKAVRTYSGKQGSTIPTQIVFEGKSDSGAQIADGEYLGRVSAEYLNGYKTPAVNSPIFVFDTTQPSATIFSYDDIFSPDGDGSKDTFTLRQSAKKDGGAPVRNWHGKILDSKTGDVVFEYDFGANPPEQISWNGLDKDKKICADGKYDYEISGEDLAGNSFSTKTKTSFTLDTSKTEVMLSANHLAFNPNGERKNVTFSSVLKSSAVKSYNFEIKNQSGVPVYAQRSNGNVPANFVWNGNSSDGNICPDGIYFASISIVSENGSSAQAQSLPVSIDTVAPFVEVSLESAIFSPDGDGRKDALKITTANSTRENEWLARILDEKNSVVKTFEWNGFFAGKQNSSFKWSGNTDNGNKAADGKYSLVISAKDAAGNSFEKRIDSIVLDARATTAYVTAERSGISPISRTGLTSQKFTTRLSLNEGIESWTFDVEDAAGISVRSLSSKQVQIPSQLVWDGKDANGKNCEGKFTGHLTVNYSKGNFVDTKTAPFICSATPPVLGVKTAPEFFSPDNDGTDDDCLITLAGKSTSKFANWSFVINYPESTGKNSAFWKTSGGEKITPQIIWDGLSNTSREHDGKAERVQSAMDYPYTFTATDALGMTTSVSGIIPVDILVIRDGSNLKMAVPSIIFRANNADFKTAAEAKGSQVTKEQAANNVRVLKRVGDILKKFPDYTVTVVGHANRTGVEGEDEILLNLSDKRAAFVKDWLVQNGGIPASRLSSQGKGASEPVAAFSDTTNWWKNRRVEFILHK